MKGPLLSLRALHRAGQRAWASLPIAEPQEPQLPPFDHTPAPYEGLSRDEVLALRKQYLSPGMLFRPGQQLLWRHCKRRTVQA